MGLTMLLRLWSVCRQSGSSTRQPLPQEMGAQPNVPVDPRGAGYAWTPAPRPPAPPGWLCPVDPNAYLSPWLLALGLGGPLLWSSRLQVLQCWGFLGNSVSSPLKKNLGKVWLWRNAWPFPSPPSNFLLPGARALPGQPGGEPQSKNWKINSFSVLCQSVKCWETRPCAPC